MDDMLTMMALIAGIVLLKDVDKEVQFTFVLKWANLFYGMYMCFVWND